MWEDQRIVAGETRQRCKEEQTVNSRWSPTLFRIINVEIAWLISSIDRNQHEVHREQSIPSTINLPVRRGRSSSRILGLGHLNGLKLNLFDFAIGGDDIFIYFIFYFNLCFTRNKNLLFRSVLVEQTATHKVKTYLIKKKTSNHLKKQHKNLKWLNNPV